MAAQVTFETATYEWAHGKKPRGTGEWAFEFITADGYKLLEGDYFWTHGTYTEAKEAARAEARMWWTDIAGITAKVMP